MSTDPLFMKVGSEYYWYQNDHLGTPQKMTTTSGAVVWSAKYTIFGKATVDPSSTIVNPLRFAGQYYDGETGLHYNYHRYYDPSLGRYLRADPIGLAGGINLYAYVQNNPINYYDPFGLLTKTQCAKIRQILDYEKKYGTTRAAWHFSNTWFGGTKDRLGPEFDNQPIDTAHGVVDLDWFTDIRSWTPGGVHSPLNKNHRFDRKGVFSGDFADALYVWGKSIWKLGRGELPNYYEDPKEVNTLNILRKGYDSYSDLFPPSFLDAQCPKDNDCKK